MLLFYVTLHEFNNGTEIADLQVLKYKKNDRIID